MIGYVIQSYTTGKLCKNTTILLQECMYRKAMFVISLIIVNYAFNM